VAEQLLTYEKTFKGVHKISALAGYTAEKYESQNFSISARGFAREEEWAQEYANASDFTTDRPSSGYGSNALVSMLGRIAYSYADKYYLTGVVRRDGTSKVTKENRWGVFPSVSIAWRVSEESFLRDVEILNDLKIRASWGKMGNINPLGNYEFAVPLSLNNRILRGVPPTLITGYYMNGISNRELKWETTASQDIGFDALLLNNRLSITADYYNKKVTDMLVRPELIQFAGVGNSPWVNAGETKNTGIELMLGWRYDIGNFDYDVLLNIAHNKNELVKYKAGKDFEMHGDNVRSALYPFRSEIGYPFYSFYLIEYAGIFQSDEEAAGYVDNLGNRIQPNAKAGDMKFVDRNSDGKIDFNDKRICGDYYPDLTYGMNISLSYKNFDCSMFFQGVQNVDIFTGYKFSTYMPTQGYNMLAKAQDAWSPTNKGSDIPILQLVDANRNYSTESDWYLEDGSYLRLKNFTLGYNLPGRLLSFAGVSRFRVYFSSQNLLTFTKYEGFDPEIGENGLDMMKYPQSRTFMFGANISF